MTRHLDSLRPAPLVVLLTVAALLAAGAVPKAHAAGGRSWDPVERVQGVVPVVVTVKGKSRIYFEVSPKRPLELSVTGPARVRVVTRAMVAAGVALPVSYAVKVVSAGATLGESKTESSPADRVRRRDGKGVVCKSRTLLVSVPAGVHGLSIGVEGAPDILARILVASPQREPDTAMISLTPLEAARSVTVAEGERLIPYYTTRRGRPVRFRIVGPTSVEVTSRLDFDSTMRGPQRYRLAIRAGGAPTREETFTTTKAAAATYAEMKDRVPSKIDRIVLTLGDGTHELAIEILSPKQGVAQIHARIPQPSVGNEE